MTVRHVSTLLSRELAAYFLGPMAYLVLLAFQVIAFLNFWELVDLLSQRQQEFSSLRDPMSTYISGSPAFWIALLVAVPVLTMRLFSEERRSGTIETLLTLPVTEAEIVLAKWMAGVVMFCAAIVPFAIYLPFLYYQARYYFDVGPVLTLTFGLFTTGMMLVSIGLFFSSLTANQLVAAIWTFAVLFLLIAIAPLFYIWAARQHASWADGVRFTALLHQAQTFAAGQLDLRFLVLHLSVCIIMLYLTARVLHGRASW
jgi:ABC-2 type transport system permease protein